jgi:IMP dehydrogenase/GMP reductase
MKYKLIEITSIEKIDKNQSVYDLTVENNHSYTANDLIVHNCLTTEQSAIGYPMASLIKDTYEESLKVRKPAKIIADGGIKKYSDAIKALALGANMVMLGGVLNKALESSGDCYIKDFEGIGIQYKQIEKEQASILMQNGGEIYKQYKGMSTKEVQRMLGNDKLKTSEGIVKYNRVEYTLGGWVENFDHYLKSNMSYCGKISLDEFIGKVEYNHITYNSFLRYSK